MLLQRSHTVWAAARRRQRDAAPKAPSLEGRWRPFQRRRVRGIADQGIPQGEREAVRGPADRHPETAACRPAKFAGDKGYSAGWVRQFLRERGSTPVIAHRKNEARPEEFDAEAYRQRNLIERCVGRLKEFRRIATRYEKTAISFAAMLFLVGAMIWLR